MKKVIATQNFLSFFLYIVLILNILSVSKAFCFPAIKNIIYIGNNMTSIGRDCTLIMNSEFKNKFQATIGSFKETINQYKEGNIKKIYIKCLETKDITKISKSTFGQIPAVKNKELYVIKIQMKSITIFCTSPEGFINGITTLEYLIQQGNGKVRTQYILDYPDLNIRALHVVIQNINSPTPQETKKIIEWARFNHFNTIIFQIADGVKLKSLGKLAHRNAWSVEDFKRIVKYAHENGLDVVPELKLLTHQEKLFRNFFSKLMFNKYTYDPRRREVYKIVFPIISELIDITNAKFFHIGHDELFYQKFSSKDYQKPKKILPANLFLKDIIKIYSFLKEKDVGTWMWGDMFLSKESITFKSMFSKCLNAPNKNYVNIINKLPKDITVCDWHYHELNNNPEFKSIDFFLSKHFKVIGVSWNDPKATMNFSKYVYTRRKKGAIGMIATTWFYIQKKRWRKVRQIVTFSGEFFWNAGKYTCSDISKLKLITKQ